MRIILEDKTARRAERLAHNEHRRTMKCERQQQRRAKATRRAFFAFA